MPDDAPRAAGLAPGDCFRRERWNPEAHFAGDTRAVPVPMAAGRPDAIAPWRRARAERLAADRALSFHGVWGGSCASATVRFSRQGVLLLAVRETVPTPATLRADGDELVVDMGRHSLTCRILSPDLIQANLLAPTGRPNPPMRRC